MVNLTVDAKNVCWLKLLASNYFVVRPAQHERLNFSQISQTPFVLLVEGSLSNVNTKTSTRKASP